VRRPDLQEATWTSSNEALVLARELGERIRAARTDVGVEVSDLATRTRIGARYLHSIEEGKLNDLPGPVFVKGFIRAICTELGSDPLPLIELIDQIQDEEPAEETDGTNGSKRAVPLILSGVLLAVLVTGGILLHGGDKNSEEGVTKTPAQTEVKEPVAPEVDQEGFASEEPMVELDLLLRATDKTWLRIQADSSEPWETTMKEGDEITLRAVDRVTLYIGNAGGILFELNGKRFGPLGTEGQVISNYVITRDNL
jgi:transcriptional regulator with XRE-family HTH domain